MPENNRKNAHARFKKPGVSTIITFTLAFSCFSFFFGYNRGVLASPTFNYTPSAYTLAKQHPASPPAKLVIKDLNLALPIEESHIVLGKWQVSQNGLSHLDSSGLPGEHDNMVIYGHDKSKVFGHLKNIKVGALVTVTSQNGEVHTYKVIKTQVVTPDQISVVLPTKTELLTLYTCTGFGDTKRWVVQALPFHTDGLKRT